MTEPETLDAELALRALDPGLVTRCIEACLDCAQACTSCADACLDDVAVAELATCIRTNLDCADICEATARLLGRRTGQHANLVRAFLDTCTMTCATCAEECTRHAARLDACDACVEACRRCEQACQDVLDRLSAGSGAATG